MKLLKIQAAIIALVLITIPFLGINKVEAYTNYKKTVGYSISLERPEVVAKGDKVSIEAKFFNAMNADSYTWNWNVCGKKSTTTTNTWYTSKRIPTKKVGNCVISVDGEALYKGQIVGSEIGDGVIVPGSVTDTVNILPVENVSVMISGPTTAKVGEIFWLESTYSGPMNFNVINWKRTSSGVCKGSGESFTATSKWGKIAKSKGKCSETLNLRVEYANKVVKGTAVQNITIK